MFATSLYLVVIVEEPKRIGAARIIKGFTGKSHQRRVSQMKGGMIMEIVEKPANPLSGLAIWLRVQACLVRRY